MDIKELTQRMHEFVHAKGWYGTNSPHQQTLRNLAISLNLEASEVLEHFQWNGDLDDPEALSDELADVTLYLLQIASIANINLENAVLKKLDKNYHRAWNDGKSKFKESLGEGGFRVTVFGGSTPRPGEPAYQEAYQFGKLLGNAGYTVLTGGYIGTMEAVSRGTAECGGHVIGVTCDEIEAWRPTKPNSWVQQEMRFPTLKQRLYALIEECDAAIALPGGIGTLAEITVMWSQLQVGAGKPRPLILVGDGWEKMIQVLFDHLGAYVLNKYRNLVVLVPDTHEAFLKLHMLLTTSDM
jgi:uncharacterized protein (TIGR00730 family)